MPDIFKALASIMAWVLWICALVMGFTTMAMGIIAEDLFNPDVVAPVQYTISFGVALAFGIGSAVVMLIRKKLE